MAIMTSWRRVIALLWLTSALPALAAEPDARVHIDAANARWNQAAAQADVEALASRYVADATLMPEHNATRRGAPAVTEFLRQWWQQAGVRDWQRQSEEVIVQGDAAIETGRFEQPLAQAGKPAFAYRGKYLVVWRRQDDGWRAMAELWGADSAFAREQLPAIDTRVGDAPADRRSDAIATQIAQRNALISQLVQQRRGAEHALLFAPDAAYLTYYTPTLRGSQAITGYFVEHERPGLVSIDHIDIRSDALHALADGQWQLEEGSYRVGWRAGGDHGVVEGKSLNLWARNDAGEWMLLRQAVNHD